MKLTLNRRKLDITKADFMFFLILFVCLIFIDACAYKYNT